MTLYQGLYQINKNIIFRKKQYLFDELRTKFFSEYRTRQCLVPEHRQRLLLI